MNDLVPADNLAYLFKYDSTHGIYQGTVAAQPDGISIDNRFVSCLAIKDPAELPWGKLGADYVGLAELVPDAVLKPELLAKKWFCCKYSHSIA